jgi:hypothetical protein
VRRRKRMKRVKRNSRRRMGKRLGRGVEERLRVERKDRLRGARKGVVRLLGRRGLEEVKGLRLETQ